MRIAKTISNAHSSISLDSWAQYMVRTVVVIVGETDQVDFLQEAENTVRWSLDILKERECPTGGHSEMLCVSSADFSPVFCLSSLRLDPGPP